MGLVEDGVRWTSTRVQNARTDAAHSTATGVLDQRASAGDYGSTRHEDEKKEEEIAALVNRSSDSRTDENSDDSDDSLVE